MKKFQTRLGNVQLSIVGIGMGALEAAKDATMLYSCARVSQGTLMGDGSSATK